MIESQSPSHTLARPGRQKVPRHELITLQTDARHFEGFLRSIGRCDSLLDARRLKSDIVGEVRRTRTLLGVSNIFSYANPVLIFLAEHENEDWIDGRKTEDIVAFLDRLYTAKRKVEKRIAILGGQDENVSLRVPSSRKVNIS